MGQNTFKMAEKKYVDQETDGRTKTQGDGTTMKMLLSSS
jgi:hypothetical protein